MANVETLERFANAGLALRSAPTRIPSGGAVIAQNVFYGHKGSLNSRPGYTHHLPIALGAPISMVLQIDGRTLLVAGSQVDEEGDYSCE